MIRHTSPISGIASYADKYIATAGYDNRVILWDAKTNLPIAVGYHDHLANQCEFSKCGTFLVTSSSDYTTRLWHVPEMKLIAVCADHTDDVEYSTLHPVEAWIATASRDNKIRIFDFNGYLLNTIIGHTSDVISVQWLESSKHLVSSSDDGTIRVWDADSGREVEQLTNSGIQTDALAISPVGYIYAGDDEGNLHVITKHKKITIHAHQAGIKRIIFSSSINKLISLSYDRKACIFNVNQDGMLSLFKDFTLPNIIWARSCAFHGTNKIVFATFGDTYAIYDYEQGLWKLDNIHDTHGINAILVSESDIVTIGDAGELKINNITKNKLPSLCNFLTKNRDIIFTGGQSGEIFNAESGEVIYKHHSPLNCAANYRLNDTDYVVFGSYTGEAIILKLLTDRQSIFDRTILLHHNAIKSLAVQSNILFSVCATGACAWHSLANGQQLKFVENAHDKIANACVSLNERDFASISRDLHMRIWNGIDFTLRLKSTTPHQHSIKCISKDTTSRYIATGSYNGEVAIYDNKISVWYTFKKTTAGISSLCFNPTTCQFLAASYDGHIYSIDRGEYEGN